MRIVVMMGMMMMAAGGLTTGCAPPPASEGGFDSPDPGARLYAIQRAGNEKDRTAIGHLIESLDSDDMAVRMYAINALERITGDRLGYVYYEAPSKRQIAIDRWDEAYRSGRWSDKPGATAKSDRGPDPAAQPASVQR